MPYTLHTDGPYLEIRVTGVVTDADLQQITVDAARIEAERAVTPSRLVDLHAVTGLQIGFPEIFALAQWRRSLPVKNPVRTAIVVATDAQYGMARMFQTLNTHPQITLEIFRDRTAAEAWLAERA